MSLQARARAAFAGVKSAVPSSVVTVVSGAQTAQGVKNTKTDDTSPGNYGEQGVSSGHVYVDASEMTTPARGSTIVVDGNDVFVMQTSLDPAGAILKIAYQDQRQVEGI